ncbi:MAG: VanZ family protein [Acidobacteriia bacterium]|nr:VanZ family protein [Terriglobia bacterium]
MNSDGAHAKMLSGSCLLVLGCILVAGLWPFHTPHNAVSWLKNEDGLAFGRHGSVLSVNAFRNIRSANDAGYSLEIRLTPEGIPGGGSILAFDSSQDPRAPFLLRQYGTSIAVQRYMDDQQGHINHLWFRVDHVFQAGKRVLVTVTSNKNGTLLYVNGALAGADSDAGIVGREFTGRLVLANSTVDDSWTGQIAGLAIYDRELTPAQVSSHFQSWTPAHGPLLTGEQPPVALYLFDERGGSTVRNVVDPTTNLTIPASYFVLHPAFLRSTREVYARSRGLGKSWSFWEDLGVNIGGFVPLGFAFYAYFSSVKRTGRAALLVVTLGFFLSFAIEALQWLLPTRDSGMTDLFTNTTGTALGVLLHRSSTVQALWTKVLNLGVPYPDARLQRPVVESHPPAQDEKLTFSA